MPIVKMPDGKNVRFPDDMPREQIKQFIVSKFSEVTRPTETPPLPQVSDETRQEIADRMAGYENKNLVTALKGNDWLDVAKATGKGLLSGAESYANAYTLGGYEWAGDKLGLGVSDRKSELQRQAEENDLGGFNKAANFMAELGGGLKGAARLSYNLAKKGLSAAGKASKIKYLANSGLLPLTLSGGLDAGINSAFRNDFANSQAIKKDTQKGALVSGLLGVAGKPLVPLSKLFSAKSMTKGLKGGLENVVNQPQAVKILNSGVRQSDDIAQEFLNKAPVAARNINAEAADSLNLSLKRRVNVPETVARQKTKYRDFLNQNADLKVLNFAEEPSLARRYVLDNKDYQPVLKSIRRNMQKNNPAFAMGKTPEGKIDYPHFLKDQQRAEYVTTLPGTYKNPQEVIPGTHNNKQRKYLLRQYFNPLNGEDVYDIAIKSGDGTLINKITREGRNGRHEFEKMRRARTSAGGTTSRTGQMEGTSVPAEQHINNILSGEANVKNIKALSEGLTPYQKNALQKAINLGVSKTNRQPGSLESVNRIKQELNDMIVKSQNVNPNNRLSSVDSSDTVALREIKKRVDEVLGGALKGRDRGYRKAKQLEEAYNAGLRYSPNNINSLDLVSELNPLNKQGFAQGLFCKINNNSLAGQNLAADALKFENTLSDVLPKSKYEQVIDNLNRQSTKFGRLSNLGSKAETRLRTPELNRLFAREQLESKGSLLGTGLDYLNSTLRGGAIKKASQHLMNPNFIGLKDSWVLEKFPYMANYLSLVGSQK